jgi:hypothetical protein
MPLPGLEGIVVPELLQPHRVDVQRLSQSGTDQSGMPVDAPATVYSQLPVAVDLQPYLSRRGGARGTTTGDAWEQPGMEVRGYVYFGTQVGNPPALPDIRKGDRLLFGTWPNGQPMYLDVRDYLDELGAGIVGVCTVTARKPGG